MKSREPKSDTHESLFDGPGLYVHVPFCGSICPYCDFYVLTGDTARRRWFVELLRREIQLQAEPVAAAPVASRDWPFDTIYFGGGTPSILEAEEIGSLLEAARRCLPVHDDAWIYLEANPEDVSVARLTAWRALGVQTLSLGVQSLDDAGLRFLGRQHSAAEARRAAELAGQAGFRTLSIDLIYGLPDQSAASWRRDLEAALALAPDHLSCYQLTVHDRTPFGAARRRGNMVEAPDERQAELFRLTHELLAGRGYAAYEVSNFARGPAHESRHNRKYWRHRPYLGVGPSAHSYAGRRRWWNERKIKPWTARVEAGSPPLSGEETLTDDDLELERIALGLRTADGVRLAEATLRANAARLDAWISQGLARVDGRRLRLTRRGLALADGLAASIRLAESA